MASWLSDCRESGRSADPRVVYEKLRDLDRDFPSERTAKELKRLRKALDLQFNASTKRTAALGSMFERAGSNCIWCGRALSARHLDSSYEHLIPRSRQGSDHNDNLLPACMDCNNRRSNISPGEWLAILVEEGNQPRIDLVWDSLVACTGPGHGVRMHKRAVQYLDEIEPMLEDMSDQPYMPQMPAERPAVAKPKAYNKNYKRPRRRRR